MFVNIVEAGDLRSAMEREAENIGHVSVREVISRSKYNPLGRRDFTRADLDAYLPDEDYQSWPSMARARGAGSPSPTAPGSPKEARA